MESNDDVERCIIITKYILMDNDFVTNKAMEQLVVEICKAEDSNREADDISPESYGGAEVE